MTTNPRTGYSWQGSLAGSVRGQKAIVHADANGVNALPWQVASFDLLARGDYNRPGVQAPFDLAIPQAVMLSPGFAQLLTYYKRYRMECPLDALPPSPALPAGYTLLAWQDALLESHSTTLERCFHNEMDSLVFPSLGCLEGCRLLLAEIGRKSGFLPGATWLLTGPDGGCGTVQGVAERNRIGAIQNIGITPGHRGRGLGRALLLQALAGFRQAGLTHALLEVTARNEGAVRLYQSVGFRKRKTVYKAVDTSAAALALTA